MGSGTKMSGYATYRDLERFVGVAVASRTRLYYCQL